MVQLGVKGNSQASVGKGLSAGRKRARTRWGPDDPAEALTTGDADQVGNAVPAAPAAASPLEDLPSNGTAPKATRKPKRTRWVPDEEDNPTADITEVTSVLPAVSLQSCGSVHTMTIACKAPPDRQHSPDAR